MLHNASLQGCDNREYCLCNQEEYCFYNHTVLIFVLNLKLEQNISNFITNIIWHRDDIFYHTEMSPIIKS